MWSALGNNIRMAEGDYGIALTYVCRTSGRINLAGGLTWEAVNFALN